VPGNLGGLGRVLGQVGRHRVVGEVAVDRNPDGSDVELVTPADLLPLQSARVEFGLESDLEAGGSDGIEAVGDQPQLLQGVRDEIAGLGLSLTSVPVDA
jgi:hypothetical protein